MPPHSHPHDMFFAVRKGRTIRVPLWQQIAIVRWHEDANANGEIAWMTRLPLEVIESVVARYHRLAEQQWGLRPRRGRLATRPVRHGATRPH